MKILLNGNLKKKSDFFLQTLQNIVHLLGQKKTIQALLEEEEGGQIWDKKKQFRYFWKGEGGGVCMSLFRARPPLFHVSHLIPRIGKGNWLSISRKCLEKLAKLDKRTQCSTLLF